MSRRVAQDPNLQTQSIKTGSTFAAAFHYTEPSTSAQSAPRSGTSTVHQSGMSGLSPRRRAAQAAAMNGYVASPDLPPPPAPTYVRALYNYDADDRTSLSFRAGDIIQVLTQLESGWWDGVINDVRGWFPSNYTVEISDSNELGELAGQDESETGSGTEEDYDDEEEDSDVHTQDEDSDLPIEGASTQPQEEAAFWVPQATPDGRLFYFNTLTGVSTMELPLETPTSSDETGPRDRNNFHVPDQTRPPPEMMAGRYGQNEEDYDGSASEADGERSFRSSRKKGSLTSASISTSTSMDSIDVSAARQAGNQFANPLTSTFGSSMALPPLGTTATSFTVPPHQKLSKSPMPKCFLDDTGTAPVTWNTLVENMRAAIEAYRHAIRTHARAEYVRRAEDISDHLRMLLAAGSGTTDNHSGNPSIISTNKALYPHFREMMSKFSKLVLSSHIAAADWPGPDALTKCLQEAEGVMNGVYGYADVAKQQRGEEIPRLVPGFIIGSKVGGSWRDNNIDSQANLEETSFMDSGDELSSRPSALLDANLLQRIDDYKKNLAAAIRSLEEGLVLTEKIVTPARQSAIGDDVCQGAGIVIDYFRPWSRLVESIDLSMLGNVFQKPSLVDFGSQKQRVYDSVGELVLNCQAVTAPLADEWAEIRGESLDTRLSHVRGVCKQLDAHISNLGYALQLLLPATSLSAPAVTNKRDHRITDGGETYLNHHLRSDSNHAANPRPALADVGQSKSYTLGQEPPQMDKIRRPPSKDKARQFFGQIPPNLAQLKTDIEPNFNSEDMPWYLALDHADEVVLDTKANPPQVKSGSLIGLVEQLTRHDRHDTTFANTFLLTHRSFTTAAELFELLVKRFNLQPPAGLNRDEFLIWEEHKQKPARFRVLNILKQWLETYWMESDNEKSRELLGRIMAFAKNALNSTKIPLAKSLITLIDQRLKGLDTSSKKLVLTITNSAPPPIMPKNMKKIKFLDIDPTEFARQLTIMESRLYAKIKPSECLAKTWEKKAADMPPFLNVQAAILHSNQLTNWTAEMILGQAEVKKRVVVVKHFVAIADKCRALNNFSAVTAIISAFGTAPILRLSRTWHLVKDKTSAMLESMRQLISTAKNFSQYRESLASATPPCIPFMGVYMTDLIFIEDGIPSLAKNSELINFSKRTKTAEVIRLIQQYQNVPYNLNPVPDLQEWIAENMRKAGDVQEMYPQSLKVEPREREEEKIARLLSESGFL
ncbi:cell division cycle-related protein [Exophiala xenobiotica]|nr:cell division cycle-related protein [Exophiala xenobiotica]